MSNSAVVQEFNLRYNYQLVSQTDPRDALPLAHRARWTRSVIDKLHSQARQTNIDRRKYCQLSSTDNRPLYHTSVELSCQATRCDDRHAVAKFAMSHYPVSETKLQKYRRQAVSLFLEMPNFYITCSVGRRKPPCQKPARSVL